MLRPTAVCDDARQGGELESRQGSDRQANAIVAAVVRERLTAASAGNDFDTLRTPLIGGCEAEWDAAGVPLAADGSGPVSEDQRTAWVPVGTSVSFVQGHCRQGPNCSRKCFMPASPPAVR